MPEDSNDIDRLMRLALDGDSSAYEQLLKILMHELRNLSAKWLSKQADQEDLIQDILLSIHLSRASYNPELPLRPWVYALARRRAIDFLRKNKKQKSEILSDNIFIDEGNVSTVLSSDIISNLNEKERDIFNRIYLANESNKKVAKKYNISEGALRVALHRIKDKVKNSLKV